MSFIYIFDLFGTFIFAISGAMMGLKKKFDIYGMFILSFAVAVGGGTVRDIMLMSIPFALKNPMYLILTILAVILVAFFNKIFDKTYKFIILFDAIGLGVFTVIGVNKAIDANLSWYAAIMLGILTSTGGGMIRDLLAHEVPFVLQKEVYASASIIGGIVFVICNYIEINKDISSILTAALVFTIRMYTYKKGIHIPKL